MREWEIVWELEMRREGDGVGGRGRDGVGRWGEMRREGEGEMEWKGE